MNQAELAALKQPISHYARVLYCLYLRPEANQLTGASPAIDYKQISQLLSDTQTQFDQGRQINLILHTLLDVGLISVNDKTNLLSSVQDQRVTLPLMILKDDEYQLLHGVTQAMQQSWMPEAELYTELAQLIGLIDSTYTQEQVGEFVAYWLGRPQSRFSRFQWTQKFVLQRKQFAQRSSQQQTATQTIGTQTVTASAGISTDANTRALVEKYNKPT